MLELANHDQILPQNNDNMKVATFVDSLRNLLPWQRSWVSKYDHKIEIS